MSRGRPTLLACVLLASQLALAAGAEKSFLKASPDDTKWWREARFGMFICWGPVSLKGVEIGWGRGKARHVQPQGGGGPIPVEVYDNLY